MLPYAVAAIGGKKARELALRLLQKRKQISLYPSVAWLLNDIDLNKACMTSVEHGLMAQVPTPQQIKEVRLEDEPHYSPYAHWLVLLERQQRAVSFDVETDQFPNEHDKLISHTLAGITNGRFLSWQCS